MKFTLSAAGISLWAILIVPSLGCQSGFDPGAGSAAAVADDDPLAVPTDLDPGTLDALHRDVSAKSCAAQPGLCHHGQFEPNLSTPQLAYENLVRRPGKEHANQYRVLPGSPDKSLVVDKLRNRGVLSQMPLGAHPLPEEDIAAIEKWIADGALRRPGAEPAPELNNPPAPPEIAVFDEKGNRLGAQGSIAIAPGTKLVFRHSARDFETGDAAIPYSAFFFDLADGRSLVLGDAAGSETAGSSAYEADGAPEGKGDLLDFRFDWTVPETASVMGYDGAVTQESTAGMSLTVTAAYMDSAAPGQAMLTYTYLADLVKVNP